MARATEGRHQPGPPPPDAIPAGLFREAFDRSAAGVVIVAPDGTCLLANRMLCELSGYEAAELAGMPAAHLAVARARHHVERLRQQMLDGKLDAASREAVLARKDGSHVWVRVTTSLLRDQSGAPTYFVAQLVDVSDRRLNEEQLARSQQIARIGSWEWDVTSDSVTWSDELYTLYGVDPKTFESTYEGFLALVHPEDRSAIERSVSAVLSGQEDGYHVTIRIVRPDGSAVPVDVTTEALRDDTGRLVRLAGVARDVTAELDAARELTSLRGELAQAHRLEAIGRLAGGVAHEINNALTAIGGYAELVLEQLPPGHPARRDVESLRRVAGDVATLPRQLLAFARRQSLRPRSVDVGALVGDAEPLLRHLLAPRCHLRLLGAPTGVRATVDPGQLQLVLVNLVLNARDAMPEGGTATIETDCRELWGADASALDVAPGTYAALVVSDDGVGMDEDTVRHALEPFFTTKPDGDGGGLGLATVYGAARQSGGTVTIDSRPGAGTRVEVLIPATVSMPREPVALKAPESTTVLVVEDQPAVRSVAERALKAGGYRVVGAASAAEALAAADEHAIDLLVADIRLSGGPGGIELARELRARQSSLPVVLVSGYTDVELEPGDHVFLPKPFSPGDLQAAAAAALGQPPPADAPRS